MSLGSEPMKDIGNVYCAALPAWMAAGLEDAHERGADLAGRKVLAVGYGSGDAAEAIPMTVAPQAGATRPRRSASRRRSRRTKTSRKRNTRPCTTPARRRACAIPKNGFVIQSIGSSANPNFSDEGIEYYRFVR